jgi:hypothetical protein
MCALKHLSQAWVISKEVRKGYPAFYWLVMGHMAEAEDELVNGHEEQAIKIRDARQAYQFDADNVPDFESLIDGLHWYDQRLARDQLDEAGVL